MECTGSAPGMRKVLHVGMHVGVNQPWRKVSVGLVFFKRTGICVEYKLLWCILMMNYGPRSLTYYLTEDTCSRIVVDQDQMCILVLTQLISQGSKPKEADILPEQYNSHGLCMFFKRSCPYVFIMYSSSQHSAAFFRTRVSNHSTVWSFHESLMLNQHLKRLHERTFDFISYIVTCLCI